MSGLVGSNPTLSAIENTIGLGEYCESSAVETQPVTLFDFLFVNPKTRRGSSFGTSCQVSD